MRGGTWQERLASARASREARAASDNKQELTSTNNRWTASFEMLSSDVQRATLRDDEQSKPLSFADIIQLWASDSTFAEFFVSLLAASPFESFFFETPPITKASIATRHYEHVTVRAHRFARADSSSFDQYLSACTAEATSFTNLGGDATLVAPCARGPNWQYGHIAAFTRGASPAQQHAFWRLVGATLAQTLEQRGDRRTWLNTEGSGVPWLHIRIDSTPKYYHHDPYRRGEVDEGRLFGTFNKCSLRPATHADEV